MRLTSLKPIDVLCVEPQKQLLVVKQSKEVVGDIRLIVPRVQFLGQCEKRLGIVKKIVKFKNGLWVWDVILLQVVVQATPWGSVETEGEG